MNLRLGITILVGVSLLLIAMNIYKDNKKSHLLRYIAIQNIALKQFYNCVEHIVDTNFEKLSNKYSTTNKIEIINAIYNETENNNILIDYDKCGKHLLREIERNIIEYSDSVR